VIIGRNGQGKTNLVEAVGYLSTLESFRGVPGDVLIGSSHQFARIEAALDVDGRAVDLDATIARRGPNKTLLNGQRVQRARDLLGVLRVTIFTPDDLELIKAGPAVRRRFLDDLLVTIRPSLDAVRADLDRVLRQRAVLLKQSGGRLDTDATATLDIWDARLSELGTTWGHARADLVAELTPWIGGAYERLAGQPHAVTLTHEATWMEAGLAAALAAARHDDLRRGTNGVGPHRDDMAIELRGAPARTHASQGEQRCLALALRLGGHELVRARYDSSPVLLLDDVFSELDPIRTEALIANLPPGQTLLTTAEAIPEQARPDLVVRVESGTLR
jgi:DNA replication and repair protein RecF